MYLDDLKRVTDKLYSLANSPEIDTEKLGNVLFEASAILRRLPEQKEFLEDLDKIERLKEQYSEEYKELILNYSTFTDFFILEQQLLLDYKLNHDIVLALGAEAEALFSEIQSQDVTKQKVLESILDLEKHINIVASNTLNSADLQVLSEKALQGLMGASIVGVNLKSLPLEIGLPGASLLLSSTSGYFLIKNSVSKEHLFGRIKKFFRRRKP